MPKRVRSSDVSRQRPDPEPPVRGSTWACAIVALAAVAVSACGGGARPASPAQPTAAAVPAWPSSERIQAIREHLHASGSGAEARALFPDMRETFVDDGHGQAYNPQILPFRYYWSASGGVTVAICAVGSTVLICPYYLDRLIKPEEFSRCDVADIYRGPDETGPGGRP